MVGTLVTADEVRCTLRLSSGKEVTISLASLQEESRTYARQWLEAARQRGENPPPPVKPWPRSATAGENSRVTTVSEDAAGGAFVYRSRHFQLNSPIALPSGVTGDMAKVFESTLAAIRAAPLGLDPETPEDLYQVHFYATPDDYADAGGPGGTGGRYHGHSKRMLILMPNLGIGVEPAGRTSMNYKGNEFILKHEVTHQILDFWIMRIPIWLNEGISEYFAAVPYRDGVYTFNDIPGSLLRYANKWRQTDDQRQLQVIHPEELMNIDSVAWGTAIAENNYIITYNSAALLTHYFLHDDGDQRGAGLIGYLHALRNTWSLPELQKARSVAREKFLLRGRSYDQIAAAMTDAWKKRGVTLQFRKSADAP